MATSVGWSTARYSRATQAVPRMTAMAHFPRFRHRPAGTSVYSAPTSASVSIATGRDGWE